MCLNLPIVYILIFHDDVPRFYCTSSDFMSDLDYFGFSVSPIMHIVVFTAHPRSLRRVMTVVYETPCKEYVRRNSNRPHSSSGRLSQFRFRSQHGDYLGHLVLAVLLDCLLYRLSPTKDIDNKLLF